MEDNLSYLHRPERICLTACKGTTFYSNHQKNTGNIWKYKNKLLTLQRQNKILTIRAESRGEQDLNDTTPE